MPAVHDVAVMAQGLTIAYGAGEDAIAVNGIDLEARSGEVLVLLGPNGAGKTSTIEALEGYRRARSGHMSVLGLHPIDDHRALTQKIGVMLQKGGVYPMLGPRQALNLFAGYYPDPMPTDTLLDMVSLRAVAGTPWRHLSGGEQQRLSLALALIGRPRVAFLDEPTAGVDPEGRHDIRAVIADLRSQGVCVMLATHELGEAETLADRIVILSAGRIVLEGTPTELAATSEISTSSFGAPAGLDTTSMAEAIGDGASIEETAPGRYRINGPSGPRVAAALTTWLADRDITLADFRTGRSLEDVYFDAVGASALEVETAPTPSRGRRGRRRSA
jgi:ABC-2 type transport system ATP-binding protein